MTARRQELTGWALVRPDGSLCEWTAFRTRREVVNDAVGIEEGDHGDFWRATLWGKWRRDGFTARRVRVTVEVEE